MKKAFTINDLVEESHTIRTKDNQVWLNMGQGMFVNRESIYQSKPQMLSTGRLFPKIDSVMSKSCLIAKFDKRKNLLVRTEPKKIKTLA